MCEHGAKPTPVILWDEDRQDIKIAKVDPCLACTIHELNARGIRTIACCCTHGKWPHASIRIQTADVQRAENVGHHAIYHEGCWSVEIPYWLLQKKRALLNHIIAEGGA